MRLIHAAMDRGSSLKGPMAGAASVVMDKPYEQATTAEGDNGASLPLAEKCMRVESPVASGLKQGPLHSVTVDSEICGTNLWPPFLQRRATFLRRSRKKRLKR